MCILVSVVFFFITRTLLCDPVNEKQLVARSMTRK
nr:MAG TPA: hypothetical protein [Caudoviricetes sp.]